jgi:bifunctional DNase/RNase
MIEVRVSRLAMDGTANAYVVVLQEVSGERMLPIWIGRAEAEAIARHLEGTPNERPMTHDLARQLVESLDARVVRVLVTHVESNTFYAQVVMQAAGEERTVDARPSDAIALALRCDAEIFAAEELLAVYPALRDDADAVADAVHGSAGEDLSDDDADGQPSADASEAGGADAGDGEGEGDAEGDADGDAGDAGGYRSPPAAGERGPTDLQRYLEQLRPEDFGKFRL